MADVTGVVGAGGIGQAIARRISSGRHVLVANHTQESADAAARVLENAGFKTTTMQADVSDRGMIKVVVAKAHEIGAIKALVQAAGVSPSQAPIEAILRVDLYGTSMLLGNSANKCMRVRLNINRLRGELAEREGFEPSKGF